MGEKIIRYFTVLLIVCGFLLKTYYVNPDSTGTLVRIALLKDVTSVTIAVRGRYQIIDPLTDREFSSGKRLRTIKIYVGKDGLVLGDQSLPVKRIRVIPQKDVTILVNGENRRYRDDIDIMLLEDKSLAVINRIELEKYIQGVLYHEVSHRWPLEAIKSQAVAVRTYALYQIEQNKKNLFDLTSDIYSQVYGGRDSERYRTNIAVRRTRGEVILYKGKIFPAYYSSNCGGHTEDVREMWDQDLPPLRGVVCPFCLGTPNSAWKKNFRSKDIQEKLNENGYKIGTIKDIKVIERNLSGRVRKMTIIDRDDKTLTLTGKDFRRVVGPNLLKSNLFDVVMQGYYFDVLGSGWGHGVGMCQWGSYGMALQHYNYKEILNYYYPGTEFAKF